MGIKRAAISVGVVAVLSVAVASIYLFSMDIPDDIPTGPIASGLPAILTEAGAINMIDLLPPSASGIPSGGETSAAPSPSAEGSNLPNSQTGMVGTTARGRVDRVYVRVAEGVLVDLAVAPPHQRDGLLYASIEFADPLANGTTLARALIADRSLDLGIGDIVEMRFAYKSLKGPYVQNIFPLIERSKVTAIVSKAGSALATNYHRRLLARASATSADGQITGMALWNMLPLESAVKIVRGNGRQEVALFTDPYCAACQAFEQTLQKIDDVTLYVFMLPVIRPDQIEHSRSVWCSPDRAKAWIDLAMLKKPPEAAPTCDNPVNSIMALRESIGIRATPTVIFENGDRAQGSMMEGTLRARLALAGSVNPQARGK